MQLPTIENYGQYSSNNYGANTLVVEMLGIRVYYSYKTIIAFWTAETGLVISENIWSRTTGKHLTFIDPDKSKRIPHEKFEILLKKLLQPGVDSQFRQNAESG